MNCEQTNCMTGESPSWKPPPLSTPVLLLTEDAICRLSIWLPTKLTLNAILRDGDFRCYWIAGHTQDSA